MEKEYSGWKKMEKLARVGGVGGASIRHSRVGTKFRLRITLEFLDQINTKKIFPN